MTDIKKEWDSKEGGWAGERDRAEIEIDRSGRRGSRIFLQGGGVVNDCRVQRAPLAPAPTGGLGFLGVFCYYY